MRAHAASVGAVVLCLFALPTPPALAGETLTRDELRELIRLGTEPAELIRLVRDADSIEIAKVDLPDLRKLGATPELIAEIEKRIGTAAREFTIDSVLGMAKEGLPDERIIEEILASGKRFAISADEKLKLVRAKVSSAVILALEGKYIYAGFREYRDPLGTFSIQYPRAWNAYELFTVDGFKIVLSPETGVTKQDEFSTGAQIQIQFIDEDSRIRKVSLLEFHKREFPAWLRVNREFKPEVAGDAAAVRAGGWPAVKQRLSVEMMGAACLEDLVRVVAEDVLFQIEFVAPKDAFAGEEAGFTKMLRTFRPFPDRAPVARRTQPLSSADVLDRYRESVVEIQAETGDANSFGSGFFVREDGYVLTNHHVVCAQEDHSACADPSNMRLSEKISVIWDRRVGPKKSGESHRIARGVKLIDTVYSLSPRVDLALLKVPAAAGPFRAMPFCAISSGLVAEGERATALGFPLPDRFEVGNLFTTEGVISRFNTIERRFGKREARGRLNDVLTTAEIQPGNSGGPLVSLATGAAIGLNTYGTLSLAGKELNYFGVCPIDHALYHFPAIRWYPRGSSVRPEIHLELGALLLAQKNYRAAGKELDAAQQAADELNPDLRSRLLYQLYLHRTGLDDSEGAREMLERCLAVNPGHTDALQAMAYQRANAGELEKAIALADRLVERKPESYWVYRDRADIYLRCKRYDDALEDIARAMERGGGYESGVHGLDGRIRYEQGEFDKGLAAFRKAIDADPNDLGAHWWAAWYYHLKGNDQAALVEHGRILAEHPDEPMAHDNYGYFLEQLSGREEEALKNRVRALELALDRGDKPTFDQLSRIAGLVEKVPGESGLYVALGHLVHKYYPRSRHWAHNHLASFWAKQVLVTKDARLEDGGRSAGQVRSGDVVEVLERKGGRVRVQRDSGGAPARGWIQESATAALDSLTRAHYAASDRLFQANYEKESNLAGSYSPRPLAFAEIACLLVRIGEPEFLSEALGGACLGFALSDKHIEALKAMDLGGWQAVLVLLRSVRDQADGGPALGGAIVRRTEATQVKWTEKGYFAQYTFENTAEVPLMGVVFRNTYLGKGDEVLWRNENEFIAPDAVFLPGESKRIDYTYDSWEALKQAGVSSDAIESVRVEVVSARNAQVLGSLRFSDVSVDGDALRFSILNPGPFTIREALVRVDYKDEDGDPLRHRVSGGPVWSEPVTIRVTLRPGEKSDLFRIPNWADWDYIEGRGGSRGGDLSLVPAFAGARVNLE